MSNKLGSVLVHQREELFTERVDKTDAAQIDYDSGLVGIRPCCTPAFFEFTDAIAGKLAFDEKSRFSGTVTNGNPEHDSPFHFSTGKHLAKL